MGRRTCWPSNQWAAEPTERQNLFRRTNGLLSDQQVVGPTCRRTNGNVRRTNGLLNHLAVRPTCRRTIGCRTNGPSDQRVVGLERRPFRDKHKLYISKIDSDPDLKKYR